MDPTEQANTITQLVKDINALSDKVGTAFATKADFDALASKVAAFQTIKTAAERAAAKHRMFGTQGVFDAVAGMIGKQLIECGKIDKGGSDSASRFWTERAAGLNSTDAGHFPEAIPTEISPIVDKLLLEYGNARRYCRVIPNLQGTLQIKRRATRVTVAGQARPDATVTPANGTYDGVSLSTKQISAITTVEEKLIFDTPINVVEEAVGDLVEAAAELEDDVLFKGAGTTAHLGFTGLKTTTAGIGEETVAAASFGIDNMLNLQTRVHPSVIRRGDAGFFMHPYQFARLQQKKASTSGVYFFDPSSNSFKVGGYDIRFVHRMDSTAVATDNPVNFGDLRRAVTIGVGRDVTLKVLTELYAAENSIGFRLTYDLGMVYVQPTTVARVILT